MKINRIFFIGILFFVFVACTKKQREVPTERREIVKVTDSLFTRFPGKLLLSDEFVIWQDVFGKKGCLHVLEKDSGREVAKMLDIGQGPREFLRPSVSLSNGKKIFIYDLNSKKQAIFDLGKSNGDILFLSPLEEKQLTRKLYVDSLCSISLLPEKSNFIKVTQGVAETYLKNQLLDEKINNGFDVFQGHIAFNPHNNALVYAAYRFPYFSVYKKNSSGTFELKREIKEKVKYNINSKELKFNDESATGIFEMTLSKDYIVLLKFDKDNTYKRRMSVGRDFSKLPKTLFVYSYDGELLKKIDLGVPVLRIAGNPATNELYFISVDTEFTLFKCNL